MLTRSSTEEPSRRDDLADGQPRSLLIRGKGRKERLVPLWKQTSALLTQWLKRLDPDPGDPLFPNARGYPLSRSGIAEDENVPRQGVVVQMLPHLLGQSIEATA